MNAANRTRRLTQRPFTPQPYDRGAWVTWTDADGTARHGQITDQATETGTWWLTSLTGDDRLETYALRRLPIRTNRDRRERDERIANDDDPYLYEIHAIAYTRNERGEIHAVVGDVLAPAVASDEPQVEALARNGQTAIPMFEEEAAPTADATAASAERPAPTTSRQRPSRVARRSANRRCRATLRDRTRTQRATSRIARRGTGTLAQHCVAAGLGICEARSVAGSLRKNAAKANVAGIPSVSYTHGQRRTCTRFTPAEVARIAVIYRPRKPAYKLAAAKLSLAA